MSMRRNILATYASQIYVTLIGIAILPLYLKYLGVEAYGLVGFFTMLQAWFNLLDMGLTPTMGREAARFKAGATSPLGFRQLVRALQTIFLVTALGGCALLLSLSGAIASDWLQVQTLALSDVQYAVEMMAIGVALRWMSGLYRGALAGFEKLSWLAGFNAAIASLRFVLVLPVLIYVEASPRAFFSYQAVVAIVEVCLLWVKARSLLPVVPRDQTIGWSLRPVQNVLRFSIAIAFTSFVSILIGQVDKLMLSKLLPLTEFGYYSLAVLVAGSVMLVSGPISNVLLPRMTRLHSESNPVAMISVYRRASQGVAVMAVSVALVLAMFAEQIIWAWTNDSAAAATAGPILRLYSIGNGLCAMAAFPYYLQFAHGNMRLHLIGNLAFACVLVPALLWASTTYGALGAGAVWLAANLVFLVAWVPFVHKYFMPGLHMRWLVHDIGPVLIAAFLAAGALKMSIDWPSQRLALAVALLSALGFVVACAAAASGMVRQYVYERFLDR